MRLTQLITVVSLVTGLAACSARVGGDGRSLSTHNDELRRTNQELRKQIDETRKQLNLLEGELRTHRQRSAAASGAPGDVPGVPVLSGLKFARYTGPVDTDGDGADDEVRFYLRPVDQLGRMLVVAGELKIQVVELKAGSAPRVIAERAVPPGELDGMYRSGLTGDHYSVSVGLPAEALGEADQITATATLTEATTGASVEAQGVFPLDR